MRVRSDKEAHEVANDYVLAHMLFMGAHGADAYDAPTVQGYRWGSEIVLDSGGAGFVKDTNGVLHYYATHIDDVKDEEEGYARWRWEKVVPGAAIFITGYRFRSLSMQVVITSVDERWVTGNPYEQPRQEGDSWTPVNKVRRVGVPTLLRATCKPHDQEDIEFFVAHGHDILFMDKYGYVSTPDLVKLEPS